MGTAAAKDVPVAGWHVIGTPRAMLSDRRPPRTHGPKPEDAPKPPDDPRPGDPGEDERAGEQERIDERAEQDVREEAGVSGRHRGVHHAPKPAHRGGPRPAGMDRDDDPLAGSPIGPDEERLHGIHDV